MSNLKLIKPWQRKTWALSLAAAVLMGSTFHVEAVRADVQASDSEIFGRVIEKKDLVKILSGAYTKWWTLGLARKNYGFYDNTGAGPRINRKYVEEKLHFYLDENKDVRLQRGAEKDVRDPRIARLSYSPNLDLNEPIVTVETTASELNTDYNTRVTIGTSDFFFPSLGYKTIGDLEKALRDQGFTIMDIDGKKYVFDRNGHRLYVREADGNLTPLTLDQLFELLKSGKPFTIEIAGSQNRPSNNDGSSTTRVTTPGGASVVGIDTAGGLNLNDPQIRLALQMAGLLPADGGQNNTTQTTMNLPSRDAIIRALIDRGFSPEDAARLADQIFNARTGMPNGGAMNMDFSFSGGLDLNDPAIRAALQMAGLLPAQGQNTGNNAGLMQLDRDALIQILMNVYGKNKTDAEKIADALLAAKGDNDKIKAILKQYGLPDGSFDIFIKGLQVGLPNGGGATSFSGIFGPGGSITVPGGSASNPNADFRVDSSGGAYSGGNGSGHLSTDARVYGNKLQVPDANGRYKYYTLTPDGKAAVDKDGKIVWVLKDGKWVPTGEASESEHEVNNTPGRIQQFIEYYGRAKASAIPDFKYEWIAGTDKTTGHEIRTRFEEPIAPTDARLDSLNLRK